MDRASHRIGKCSECHEIICIEKAVADQQNIYRKTNEMLYEAFHRHVELKHSEDASAELERKCQSKHMVDRLNPQLA